MRKIIPALIGGAFFAVPYLSEIMAFAPSLAIGVVAFCAGSLVLSENEKEKIIDTKKNLNEILNKAKKTNAKIYAIINEIEDKRLVENIKEIHSSATKIIDTVYKNPKKLKQANSFLNYYLPVTLKVLIKYDEIENQRLESTDGKEFMKSAEDMISKINVSFKSQLSSLYQSDMIDIDAEMKVFDTMLKTDGYSDIKDFDIK